MNSPETISKKRLLFFLALVLIGFLLIISRLIYIGVIPSFKYKQQKPTHIYARGEILDCNYNKLATSLEVYSIFCNPKLVPDLDDAKLKKISNILEMPVKKIFSLKKRKFVWVKRKIDYLTYKKIKSLEIPGIYYTKEYKRFYPNMKLASHILGIVGIDNVGLEGVELYYDKYLNTGYAISDKGKNLDIVLSIDKNIQYIVEDSLYEACKKSKADSGTVIVMEPSTGYIVAMANYPNFDPNSYSSYSILERENIAISRPFEPGSIFKIFTTIAVISENVIKEDELFYCPGYIRVGDKKISCWKKHGYLNFTGVIKESCNVGMIKSVFRISRYKFYDHLRNLGVGNYTGIDLPGESKGLLSSPKMWPSFTKASISIGQGVSTTSIQLINSACAIFNGGKVMEPKMVKAIVYPDGTIYKKIKPVIIRQAITSSVSERIAKLLKGVVQEGGTGELADIKGYSIAGKTGTGEIYDKKLSKYDKNNVNASFIGFVPADKPKYAIIVTIHRPKTSDNSGGKVAAPVFKRIVEKIIAYNPIPAESRIYNTGNRINFDENIKISNKDKLPDFKGMNMREVLRIIKMLGCRPNLVGSGIAFEQYPEKGSKVYRGMIITVKFKMNLQR